MLTWLVTGAAGFLGRHILAALESRVRAGDTVIGLDRANTAKTSQVLRYVSADLADLAALRRLVAELRPDCVIHAAGRTPPAEPRELYRANTLATAHLLDSLRSSGRMARVVLVGSAAELGPVPVKLLPAAETLTCRPVDAYGLSKLSATWLGLAAEAPLEVMVGRIFNLVGPGLPAGQAFGRFAARLAEPGHDPLRLVVGNLTARRDFVDVRDAALGLIALAELGAPGELYHIGTGRSHSIGLGLDILVGLSGRQVEVVVQNGGRGGPADSFADLTRTWTQTQWSPQIDFETSLRDLWWAASEDARQVERACLPAA